MIEKNINAIASGVAGRYALALFELAEEESLQDVIASDVKKIRKLVDESKELNYLMRAPVFNAKQQMNIWKEIAKKAEFNPITTNFLCLLAKKRRSAKIKQIINVFFKIQEHKSGQKIVEIISAVKIKQTLLNNFEKIIKSKIADNFKIITKIDKNIVGGFIVKYNNYIVDMSIRGKLDKLRYWTKKVS